MALPTPPITVGVSGCSSSGKSTLAYLLSTIFSSPPPLSQDRYFIPKAERPLAIFTCTSSFAERSVGHGEYGYCFEKLGEGEGWRVEGPDNDSPLSVDFASLSADIEALKNGTGIHEESGNGNGRKAPLGLDVDSSSLALQYASLITELRTLVNTKYPLGLKRNFFFIEGFLLFTPPSHPDPQRRKLMALLDIKIFLQTSKEEARKRRFKRKAYRDVEEGGWRELGMMVRCEGYFEGVAWVGYEREFGWLLGGNGEEGSVREGVDVRPEGWGMEESVRWAVELLLGVVEGGRKGGD